MDRQNLKFQPPLLNFLKAIPGRPPSREYKQSMAKQARPLPGPMNRKLDKDGLEILGLTHLWESLPIQHSEEVKPSTKDKAKLE